MGCNFEVFNKVCYFLGNILSRFYLSDRLKKKYNLLTDFSSPFSTISLRLSTTYLKSIKFRLQKLSTLKRWGDHAIFSWACNATLLYCIRMENIVIIPYHYLFSRGTKIAQCSKNFVPGTMKQNRSDSILLHCAGDKMFASLRNFK